MKKSACVFLTLMGLLQVSVAKAHDPIILTSNQSTPADGPLLPDGTISFALYGSLESPRETRAFRVNFNEGDELYLSLLIPDLPPENQLDDASLPFIELVDPNDVKTKLVTTEKVAFPEPFTGTNYIRLTELNAVAEGGTYSVVITGDSPTRFTVSVGKKEMFGTPVENVPNRDLGVGGVMSWYENAPTALQQETPEMQTTVPEVLVDADDSESNQPVSTVPEVLVDADDSESNQPVVVVIILIAAIIALASIAKVYKTRNKK
ncbi:MAG: hypothetical protein O3C62_11410 [Actinomycetota bacterium]|nr:hypothetical protein [Actinomycetota bacterium]MDA3002270.1 hypothetical protein [Actinomycetota bacterium]